jgi:hypothetical protein
MVAKWLHGDAACRKLDVVSGIADLYNVPTTDAERAQWSFAHMAHHRDINAKIYLLVKVVLPEYILDPIDPASTGQWEDQHQLMHDNQNQLLGITGQDLTGVDWKDQRLLAAWIFLNSQEHYQASNILEIG